MSNNEPQSDSTGTDREEQLPLAQEFLLFVTENKKWWLIPILVVLSLVVLFVAMSATDEVPFIYTNL